MDLLSLFGIKTQRPGGVNASASVDGGRVFNDMNDPALLEFIRGDMASGDVKPALFNTTVFRCCDLISSAIAALPFRPMRTDATGKVVEALDHPLYEVLTGQANLYQTAFEFKQWMQMRALIEGDAFARIVRSGRRVIGLIPQPDVTARLSPLGEPIYQGPQGIIPAQEIFHLRGVSWNGINGLSRVRQACRAIGLAKDAEDAAVNIFRNGMAAGGSFETSQKLTPEATDKLSKALNERASGSAGAGKWLLLQDGLTAKPWQQTGRDSQQMERSKHQVEEIARVFGVPRPLLMVDDTSWGSGIEQLGIFFVTYALAPWFMAWEGRGRMSLLDRDERGTIHLDFDERELLRGSMKDQAEVFAKALGGPGAKGYMSINEVRALLGLGSRPDGDTLATGMETANVVA